MAKGKREGIHALIQDCCGQGERVWWRYVGLERILEALPLGPGGIAVYELLVQTEPELQREIDLNIASVLRCGNESLAVHLLEKVLAAE